MTYQELKSLITAKGFLFYTDNLKLNCIWQRTSDIVTNHFTDFFHIAYLENGVEKVLSLPATTKAGIKGAFDAPPTVEGITGTSVIIPWQYVDSWQFIDAPTGKGYPFDKEFFRQVKGIKYWRDGNKDQVVDHTQEQDNKIFGTHWHKMSQPGTYGSGQVNNWSEGCMGLAEPEFQKMLPIVRASVKLHGNLFTGTIITTF